MTQTIQDAQNEIVEEFEAFGDWQERYAHIIQLGKELGDIPEEFKEEKYRVKGCQSTVYLVSKMDGDEVAFDATSDAMIVRGLIALLLRVYNHRTPREIVETPPTFIQDLGLAENLTQGRANGLQAMIEQIKNYALAFETLMKSRENQ